MSGNLFYNGTVRGLVTLKYVEVSDLDVLFVQLSL